MNWVIILIYSWGLASSFRERKPLFKHRSVVIGITYTRDRVLAISCSSLLPILAGGDRLCHLRSFRAPGLPPKGSLL